LCSFGSFLLFVVSFIGKHPAALVGGQYLLNLGVILIVNFYELFDFVGGRWGKQV
jgi:hypothetical protein